MAWVIWRQHRVALSGVGALLGAVAVYLWSRGLGLHQAYAAAAPCHPASSPVCSLLVNKYNGMNAFLANGYVLQPVPALMGAFVGAPVLARELETGTFRFAWTQGFGRWRWTLAKLVTLAVLLAGVAGALSVLFSWYYRPYFAAANQSLSLSESSPLAPGLFDLHGVAFVAWALAAFAIGGLAGMLIRRVVPAIVAALVAYTGLALAAGSLLREHYLSPVVTSKLSVPGSAWILEPAVVQQRPPARGVGRWLGQVLEKGAPPAGRGRAGCPNALQLVAVPRPARLHPAPRPTNRPAGSGRSSGSRPAGCSPCRCC